MKTYTIEQLNSYIERLLSEEEIIHNISVEGEVSGLSFSGKTAFFVLKDSAAQLSCMFYDFRGSEYLPRDGEKVAVTGTPQYSKKYGSLKFSVMSVRPVGRGELYERFLKLKAALSSEGLFDAARKKAIPSSARRFAVVTSPEGAVIHDIITTARRRDPLCDILIYPVRVQGAGADQEIAAAVTALNKYGTGAELIIVARGGGATEDLENFNSETVVRAVAASVLPVVSAVGHETDTTLCDLAADVRAATPTAAAAMVTADIYGAVAAVKAAAERMSRTFRLFISQKHSALYMSAEIMNRLFKNIFTEKRNMVITRAARLKLLSEAFLTDRLNRLSQHKIRLEKSNPLSLLESGYAKLFAKVPIYSAGQLGPGDDLDVYLKDGIAYTKVKEVKRV